MASKDLRLDELFPIPQVPPRSLLSPVRLPGASYTSGLTLSRLLKDDFQRWHVFFNDAGMHNHASHHLLAIYQLGASGALLEAAYQTHVVYQKPVIESPEKIDDANFHKHLGDETFYNAYLKFFSEILLQRGIAETIEEYVFSQRVNVIAPTSGQAPMQMLNRFLAGLVHPMIHTGYGAEFGLLGMAAEGLAQTAVHSPDSAPALISSAWFSSAETAAASAVDTSISRLTELLPHLTLDKANGSKSLKQGSVHVLSIVAHILHDRDFEASSIGLSASPQAGMNAFETVVKAHGERLARLAEAWTVDGTNAAEVQSKIEELAWMNVVLYGVGGWAGRQLVDGEFNCDFLLMHLVTSALFLPSLVAYLSPRSISILLRSYLMVSLTWWIVRGRPALPIREFYVAVTDHPVERGAPHTQPAAKTLTADDLSPNPWLPIIQTTLQHPNEHLCKLQRALLHFASLYGARPAGHFAALAETEGTPLEGAETLEGSLFVRVAGLTANRLGWMREGETEKGFDFKGFVN